MAENEILDLGSRRWQRTRAALATPNLSLEAIAECAADDLNRGLRLQLSKALRVGQTLQTILQATEQHPAALRAAIENFQDQQLARIARDAAKVATTKDLTKIALCATDMLLDGLMSKALVFADRSGCFPDRARRMALSNALRQEFDSRRNGLAATIEASLRGQPVRQWRRMGVGRSWAIIDANALVRSPLAIRVGGIRNVPEQR